jgi:hypothetical protein
MKIKTSLLQKLSILFITTYSLIALAEPAMPIGTWASEKNSALTVLTNSCTYYAPGVGVNVTGTCNWKPTSATGGILTIIYKTYLPNGVKENPMYFDVQWADNNTILIYKERYHRQ